MCLFNPPDSVSICSVSKASSDLRVYLPSRLTASVPRLYLSPIPIYQGRGTVPDSLIIYLLFTRSTCSGVEIGNKVSQPGNSSVGAVRWAKAEQSF